MIVHSIRCCEDFKIVIFDMWIYEGFIIIESLNVGLSASSLIIMWCVSCVRLIPDGIPFDLLGVFSLLSSSNPRFSLTSRGRGLNILPLPPCGRSITPLLSSLLDDVSSSVFLFLVEHWKLVLILWFKSIRWYLTSL